MASTQQPSVKELNARAAQVLGEFLSAAEICEFIKSKKIRTFGKLDSEAGPVLARVLQPLIQSRGRAAPASSSKERGITAPSGMDRVITVLVEGNPKKFSAARRFAVYATGMTVGDYVAAGGQVRDVCWDAKKEWISVA